MRSALLPLGGLLSVACALFAFTAADGASKEQPPTFNPKGELKGFKAGEPARYVVWHGKGIWHVRTTTAKFLHQFSGKIRVEGGTITSIEPHDLEFKGRFGDWWKLHEKRHEINIDFKTDRGVDGINFQVSKDAKLIYFNLHIDGVHHKNKIYIGRDGQHPEMDPFVLPAHP